jgi:hypothetical protein
MPKIELLLTGETGILRSPGTRVAAIVDPTAPAALSRRSPGLRRARHVKINRGDRR